MPITTVRSQPNRCRDRRKSSLPGIFPVKKSPTQVIYEVMFTNGSKVEFRRNGAWKEVDCRYSSLPAGIVSMPIETKVQELYPGAAVIKIERDKQEVEVKLNNGMELTFDRSHNLIGIDD